MSSSALTTNGARTRGERDPIDASRALEHPASTQYRRTPASDRSRLAFAALSVVTVAVPFLVVRFPPISDLPQQVAQIRLLLDALSNPASPYVVQWSTPNRLSYGIIGAAWAVAGPERAGPLAGFLFALMWVGTVHALARAHGRCPAAATLASILVFNHALYWGLFSFLCGVPAFGWWIYLLAREQGVTIRSKGLILAAASALYLSHALWLAAGLAYLALASMRGGTVRVALHRAFAVMPLAVLAVVWFRALHDTAFSGPPVWAVPPWERVLPSSIVRAVPGALTGWTEPMLLAVVAAWSVLAIALARSERDGSLLGAAALLVAASLLLPDEYMKTALFASRWLPLSFALLLLGIPSLASRYASVVAAVVAVWISAQTAWTWTAFEREDLAGFNTSLSAIPASSRVLELDFVRGSDKFRMPLFYHQLAYAQVLKGCEISVTFADLPSSLVVYRNKRPLRDLLVYEPHKATREDIAAFEYILINAPPTVHAVIPARAGITPLTVEGSWRAYRSLPASP